VYSRDTGRGNSREGVSGCTVGTRVGATVGRRGGVTAPSAAGPSPATGAAIVRAEAGPCAVATRYLRHAPASAPAPRRRALPRHPAPPRASASTAPADPPSRTKWTRRVPHPVLIGHATRDPPPKRLQQTAGLFVVKRICLSTAFPRAGAGRCRAPAGGAAARPARARGGDRAPVRDTPRLDVAERERAHLWVRDVSG
jgi:hypothetical protein